MLIKLTKILLNRGIMFNSYGCEDEEWSDVLHYPNYMISNYGRVWNVKQERFLKPFYKFGYAHVELYYNGRRHSNDHR